MSKSLINMTCAIMIIVCGGETVKSEDKLLDNYKDLTVSLPYDLSEPEILTYVEVIDEVTIDEQILHYEEIFEEQRRLELEAIELAKWKTLKATYYTPYCKGCIGITKTGYDVRKTIYYQGMRVVAVDPKVIPLYSILDIETPYEKFTAIALDVGGSIKGNRIDILVKTKKEAFSLGRHDVKYKFKE